MGGPNNNNDNNLVTLYNNKIMINNVIMTIMIHLISHLTLSIPSS